MKYLYGTAVMAAALASAQAQDASGALVSTALEFLSRASSTSEVLTLNLTNLLILLALKAAILAFGIFAAGGSAVGRSSTDSTSITETDLTGGMCFMMYFAGAPEKLSCVQRAACDDTKTAADYYTAGKMWYKMHSVLGVPFPEDYQTVLKAVEEAKEYGLMGGDCSAAYKW